MRAINGDALREQLQNRAYDDWNQGAVTTWANAYREVADMVEDMPTIEIEQVRKGKWIIRNNPGTGWYRVTCSECGEDVTSLAPCIGFFPNVKVLWNYCPECGARMDEE